MQCTLVASSPNKVMTSARREDVGDPDASDEPPLTYRMTSGSRGCAA
jgi:hypothetical protein